MDRCTGRKISGSLVLPKQVLLEVTMQVINLLFINFNQLHFYNGSGLKTYIVFLIIFELYFAKNEISVKDFF